MNARAASASCKLPEREERAGGCPGELLAAQLATQMTPVDDFLVDELISKFDMR
jgi:hypothetical protein